VNETLMAATGASPELVQQLEVQQQFVQRSTDGNSTRYGAPSVSPQRSPQRLPQQQQQQQKQQQQQQRQQQQRRPAGVDGEHRREVQQSTAQHRHAVDHVAENPAAGEWWTATDHLGTATRYYSITYRTTQVLLRVYMSISACVTTTHKMKATG
jgi:transcription initiation factor TFIID subunit TAF12